MNWAAILKIAEAVGGLLGTLAFAYMTYKTLRDKKIRADAGMDGNPASCKDHEERLRKIEKKLGRIQSDIRLIGFKVGVEGVGEIEGE